jgi:hypothetical protein
MELVAVTISLFAILQQKKRYYVAGQRANRGLKLDITDSLA